MDNKDGNMTDKQFEWLELQLKKGQSYKHIFIALHKPPYNPYQQSWYRIETCPWSHRFMKMCEKYKVSMVFSGHEYVTRVAEFGGVKYLVSGGGGALLHEAPTWNNSFLHYYAIKVNGDYIDYEVRKVSPPIWLYFGFYLWRDAVYFVKDLMN